MTNCNCYCKTDCAGVSIVVSIIIAIIAGMLRFMGIITLTPAFLWVVFGIAVVYLGLSLFSSDTTANRCKCQTLPVYLIGILGTIFTSLVLLGIEFVATSVIGAIISGLLLGFFTLVITTAVCLIRCKTNCNND